MNNKDMTTDIQFDNWQQHRRTHGKGQLVMCDSLKYIRKTVLHAINIFKSCNKDNYNVIKRLSTLKYNKITHEAKLCPTKTKKRFIIKFNDKKVIPVGKSNTELFRASRVYRFEQYFKKSTNVFMK